MLFNKNDSLKDLLQVGGVAGTMGLHLVSATVVGIAIGYWLDNKFFPVYLGWETAPWCFVVFLFLGIVTGFKMVIEDTRRLQREEESGGNHANQSSKQQDDGKADDTPEG
ncbi:AtpZ/AtpI family protein [Salidesulfovibrio onnuriiensis]|uniref:AtpZ/AtpI family protein n=1 Tax=Salidesulfovibrio onnuriiensis TaxID=2583823 RepID=UPI0011C76671|nr:AtpZ/AtpI family protein [Salidesulfovibrio onnuriiensis]